MVNPARPADEFDLYDNLAKDSVSSLYWREIGFFFLSNTANKLDLERNNIEDSKVRSNLLTFIWK